MSDRRNKLEDKKFNKLYVKEYIGNGKYHCICDCGNECDVFATNLVRGHTTSCGCNKLHVSFELEEFIWENIWKMKALILWFQLS